MNSKSTKRLTKKIILERCEQIHGDKYDYDLSNFKNNASRINIFCKKHQHWFQQVIRNHLSGQGCPECANQIKRNKLSNNTTSFIERTKEVHGNKYDYSKTEYINNKTKVCIICSEHGEFYQKPNDHLSGKGCSKCAGRDRRIEDFIKESKIIHGDKYDYSLVEYIASEIKVKIKCNTCGTIFLQKPWSHLQKHGCPHCKFSKGELLTEKLLKDNNINYESQKRFDWLDKQSLDFFIPEYNIAIEYQGEQHFGVGGWVDDDKFTIISQRDKTKYNLCKENNINILYFTKEKNAPKEYIGELYTNEEDLLKRIKNITFTSEYLEN